MTEITPEAKKTDGITNDLVEIVQPSIEKMIYVIRDKQVMLDSDLAVLYQVETGALNRAVKRNISRFPEDFRFQLTNEEYQNLRCQTGISSFAQDENNYGGRRTLPYVFTEQGISMLASVLHSEVAIKVSIGIMRAFVEMRRFIANLSLIHIYRYVQYVQNGCVYFTAAGLQEYIAKCTHRAKPVERSTTYRKPRNGRS